jgi:Bacterial Ig domain
MKTAMLKSWILCFAVVPALLLVMYIIGQYGTSARSRPSGVPSTEMGFVDLVGDIHGADTLPASGNLYVSGWAADTAKGAPVDRVTVYVDGASAGSAMLGVVRQDVAKYYGRSDYSRSGWNFEMPASKLSPGPHTVTVTASGPSGTVQITSNRIVTIRADTAGGKR